MCDIGYLLVFPAPRSIENYAMKYPAIPSDLSQLSLCFFVKVVADQELQSIFSYAKLDDNDIYAEGSPTETAFGINDEHGSFNALVYDGAWHHLCFTWENTYGELKLYKNGKFEGQHRGLEVGYTVRSGGHLVLGQDQDTFGGGFQLENTLNAQLAEVNMWDRVLSESEIASQYTNCRIPSGPVVAWSELKTLTHGSVIVKH